MHKVLLTYDKPKKVGSNNFNDYSSSISFIGNKYELAFSEINSNLIRQLSNLKTIDQRKTREDYFRISHTDFGIKVDFGKGMPRINSPLIISGTDDANLIYHYDYKANKIISPDEANKFSEKLIRTEDLVDFRIKDIHIFICKDYKLYSREVNKIFNSISDSRNIIINLFQVKSPSIVIHRLSPGDWFDCFLGSKYNNEKILQILSIRPKSDTLDLLQDFSSNEFSDWINDKKPIEFKLIKQIQKDQTTNFLTYQEFRKSLIETKSAAIIITGEQIPFFLRSYEKFIEDPFLRAILASLIAGILLKMKIFKKK